MATDKRVIIQFRKNLKEARKAAGLSQEEFARKSGLGRTQVVRLESGRANPTLGTMIRIAAALGLRPAELLKDIPKVWSGSAHRPSRS